MCAPPAYAYTNAYSYELHARQYSISTQAWAYIRDMKKWNQLRGNKAENKFMKFPLKDERWIHLVGVQI
jgi:hypothetical protein